MSLTADVVPVGLKYLPGHDPIKELCQLLHYLYQNTNVTQTGV